MTNENKNTTYQNLWESVKAVVRGKFYSCKCFHKKKKKDFKLTLQLKELEKKKQTKPKDGRKKELIERDQGQTNL